MDPARKEIQLLGGEVSVAYDPAKWSEPETDKEGIVSLEHTAGAGTAALITETVGVPTDRLVETLIEDFREKHPDTEVVLRETRTVGDHQVACLKLRFTVKDIPLTLYLYCFSGLVGTVQVRTCANNAAFDAVEPNFTELLNGLTIHGPKHVTLRRIRQGLRLAVKVSLASAAVIGWAMLEFLFRTNWRVALLATAGIVLYIFVAALVYQIFKFRLQ